MRRILLLLALLMFACASTETASWNQLTSGPWNLLEIEGAPVVAGSRAMIRFEAETQVFGHGGVNRFFGNYERLGPNQLRFGKLGSTRMAGPPDLMAQEARYLALLSECDGVQVDDDFLEILSAELTVLRFERAR